jgi:hypothetical protein
MKIGKLLVNGKLERWNNERVGTIIMRRDIYATREITLTTLHYCVCLISRLHTNFYIVYCKLRTSLINYITHFLVSKVVN